LVSPDREVTVVTVPPPLRERRESVATQETITNWRSLAETIYETRSNNYKSNIVHVRRIMTANEEIFRPVVELCPGFEAILSFILEDKFGFGVRRRASES